MTTSRTPTTTRATLSITSNTFPTSSNSITYNNSSRPEMLCSASKFQHRHLKTLPQIVATRASSPSHELHTSSNPRHSQVSDPMRPIRCQALRMPRKEKLHPSSTPATTVMPLMLTSYKLSKCSNSVSNSSNNSRRNSNLEWHSRP